jgi:hypothetical protein
VAETVERHGTRDGADDGLRTRDLQLGKLALYQLSYVRVRDDFSMPGTALVTWEHRGEG